jgi:hypothetical protein
MSWNAERMTPRKLGVKMETGMASEVTLSQDRAQPDFTATKP